MEQLPQLISDLALILISAGIVTIIFKRLKQPLVLGYIVAGFLAGTHSPLTPSVEDVSSIQTWADIGVIFLMFSLGLEFSFKKILKMGSGPIVAACAVIFLMMSLGNGVGHLFGWSATDSLFLGGMLAMSSTTIIYKAFDDLGLRQQKFAGEVLSVLILEDLLGILLMVFLSAIAVSRHLEGSELVGSFLQLAFFLVLWFIVGIYLIPIFLRKARRWLNGETLLVVAVGLCFLMVVTAAHAGYSTAFGAFMMGSILAETVEAERIERIVSPLKDLFGAIFFVSVGMLVDPQVLADYWLPIVVLTVVILVGQALFGTGSFLLSGQPLKVAMQCGFSLAQIGEFAFIIASLGMTLGVTSQFLYPVVVAVSIVTTFLTPYMIRAAVPAYNVVERIVPAGVRQHLNGRSGGHRHTETHSPWRALLHALAGQLLAYGTLSVATVVLLLGTLLPTFRGLLGHWPGNAVCGLLAVLILAPFLRAIVMRKNHSAEWQTLHARGTGARIGLWVTFAARYLLAAAFIYYVLNYLSPFFWAYHVAASLLIVGGIVASRGIKYISIRMERTFLQNLRLREIKAQREGRNGPAYAGRLLSHAIHLAQLEVPDNSDWAGHSLRELDFGKKNSVMIAAIVRGTHRINIPDGGAVVYPGDRIEAISDDNGIQQLARRMGAEITDMTPDDAEHHLELRRLIIGPQSPFCEKTLGESGIRDHFRCMAVGFEAEESVIDVADSRRTIHHGDALWLVGERSSLNAIIAANRGAAPTRGEAAQPHGEKA